METVWGADRGCAKSGYLWHRKTILLLQIKSKNVPDVSSLFL